MIHLLFFSHVLLSQIFAAIIFYYFITNNISLVVKKTMSRHIQNERVYCRFISFENFFHAFCLQKHLSGQYHNYSHDFSLLRVYFNASSQLSEFDSKRDNPLLLISLYTIMTEKKIHKARFYFIYLSKTRNLPVCIWICS